MASSISYFPEYDAMLNANAVKAIAKTLLSLSYSAIFIGAFGVFATSSLLLCTPKAMIKDISTYNRYNLIFSGAEIIGCTIMAIISVGFSSNKCRDGGEARGVALLSTVFAMAIAAFVVNVGSSLVSYSEKYEMDDTLRTFSKVLLGVTVPTMISFAIEQFFCRGYKYFYEIDGWQTRNIPNIEEVAPMEIRAPQPLVLS